MAISHTWRDVLLVHPAANMFPMMSETELRELGKDIRQHGLREPIVITLDDEGTSDDPACYRLLDGRNRLDAMELVGIRFELIWGRVKGRRSLEWWQLIQPPDDPPLAEDNPIREELGDSYQFVISANIHRRHLTAEQKRELIGKLLQADPTKSDRAIAKVVKADNKTVASVRAEKEATEEIPQLKKTVGADGKVRKRPMKKAARPSKVAAEIDSPDCAGTGIIMTGSSGATDVVPVAETNPIVAAWDKAGPKQRRDFVRARKVEIMKAQQLIGWKAFGDIPPNAPAPAVGADGLDIPDYLKRAPKAS
jgi:hypothetical protein